MENISLEIFELLNSFKNDEVHIQNKVLYNFLTASSLNSMLLY